jgi:hypothetical protein
LGDPESGFGKAAYERPWHASNGEEGTAAAVTADKIADRVSAVRAGWPPVAVLPRIPDAADVAVWLGTPGDLDDCVVYMDPPYADLPEVVAPAFVALGALPHPDNRSEWSGALRAHGLDALRPAFDDVRVVLAKVLGPVLAQFEVVEAVVQLVLVAMMDDLVWSQWATKVPLHDEAVLRDVAARVAHESVAALHPSVPLTGAPDRGLALDLGGRLRRPLAEFYEAAARAAPQLRKALGGADGAFCASLGAATADVRGLADLAGQVERHVLNLRMVRLDTTTKYLRRKQKITGYAATLGRDEVVRHARAYAELGAVVAISEAEVVIPEWDAVEITGGRRGAKRTFSKQQAEWLTMNRAPAHRVAVQAGHFAVGA